MWVRRRKRASRNWPRRVAAGGTGWRTCARLSGRREARCRAASPAPTMTRSHDSSACREEAEGGGAGWAATLRVIAATDRAMPAPNLHMPGAPATAPWCGFAAVGVQAARGASLWPPLKVGNLRDAITKTDERHGRRRDARRWCPTLAGGQVASAAAADVAASTPAGVGCTSQEYEASHPLCGVFDPAAAGSGSQRLCVAGRSRPPLPAWRHSDP